MHSVLPKKELCRNVQKYNGVPPLHLGELIIWYMWSLKLSYQGVMLTHKDLSYQLLREIARKKEKCVNETNLRKYRRLSQATKLLAGIC